MKTNFKKTIITMAVISTFALITGGALAGSIQASAETVTTNTKIVVEESASLRIENFGLRFKTKVATDYWKDGMEMHTLMIPTSYLGTTDLTINAHNDVKDYPLDKKYTTDSDVSNYYFNTVLTGIPQSQYGTEISMRAYVKNGETIEYATNTVSTSVAFVANAALTYNYDTYAGDLAKYLVKGVQVSETLNCNLEETDVKVNASVAYFDEASTDIISKLNEVYKLSYESSATNVLTVDENGNISLVASGEADVTVKIEELNLSATCKVTVAETAPQLAYGSVYDFDEPAWGLSNVLINATEKEKDTQLKSTGTDSNGNYIETYKTDSNAGHYTRIIMTEEQATSLKTFDWFKIKLSVELYKDATDVTSVEKIRETGTKITNQQPTLRPNINANYKSVLFGDGTVHELTWNRNDYSDFDSMAYGMWSSYGRVFELFFYSSAAPYMITRIYDIEFGYNDISSDGTSMNLAECFGVQKNELTNVKFNNEAVSADELEEFERTENGTLTFDIEKEGYAKSTFSVNYFVLSEYNPLFDFSNPDLSKITTNQSEAKKGVDDNGSYVETYRNSGATTGYIEVNFAMTDAQKAALVKYDWFKIKFSVESYTNPTDTTSAEQIRATGTLTTNGSSSIRPNTQNNYKTDLPINGTLQECTWNRRDYSDFDDMANGNEDGTFKLKFYSGSSVYIIVRVYDIEFGYNDITSNGTAINLTDEFDAMSGEYTASFTPTNGESTQITEATWTPIESGVLTLTVKKAGYKAKTYIINITVSTT